MAAPENHCIANLHRHVGRVPGLRDSVIAGAAAINNMAVDAF